MKIENHEDRTESQQSNSSSIIVNRVVRSIAKGFGLQVSQEYLEWLDREVRLFVEYHCGIDPKMKRLSPDRIEKIEALTRDLNQACKKRHRSSLII